MMNNPWYSKVNGPGTAMPSQPAVNPMPMANPAVMMGQLQQAMQSPMSYAMQAFPDVPRELWNNPPMALQHIMQTRGLTQADVNNMISGILNRR